MTNGNSLSVRQRSGRGSQQPGIREIETALEDLHEALLGAQRQADVLSRAREEAIADGLSALGSEALWLGDEWKIRLEWEGGNDEFNPRLRTETDELEDLFDELEGLVEEFIDTGALPPGLPKTVRRMDTSTHEIKEWQVAQCLQETRAEFLRKGDGYARDAQTARALMDATWDRVVQLIRTWVDDPPKTATEDWGRVVLGWRKALGLPGNEAAEILGVSPPAVTRYEKGTRSPSMAYVESMAARIIGHGAELPELGATLFRLAHLQNTTAAELIGSLDAERDSEHDVREQLGTVLDSLPLGDLRLLLTVARSRDALSALRTISLKDELAPVRTAIAKLRSEEE